MINMKSKGWLLAIAFAVIAINLIWWKNSADKPIIPNLKPALTVAAISIKDIDDDKVKMNARIVLKNPLPLEITTNRLDYQLLINGKPVLKNSYEKSITIESNDSSVIEMPMDILVKPLASVLKKLDKQKADSADYTLRATIALNMPVGRRRKFDFNETKRLPAFRLLKVKPEDLDIKKLQWKKSILNMDVVIENPNLFPFKMKDVQYAMTLGKDLVMDATIKGMTDIPAQSTVKVPVQMEVKNKEMGKLMWKTLAKDETPFEADFVCKIMSDNQILNNSKMVMRTNGKLSDLKRVIRSANEAH
jgi:LEA14-like dessication related protein